MINEPVRLAAAERAGFEQILDQALSTPDICAALRHPTTSVTAGRLRAQALAAADDIAAAATPERLPVRRLRNEAITGSPPGHASTGNGVLAALAVITPLLSATAAAIFLLLGYGLRLAGAQQPLADTLIHSGWTAAAVAAVTLLVTAITLGATAVQHRRAVQAPQAESADLTRAEAAWRDALLERGILHFLHANIHTNDTPAPPAPTQRRTLLGYRSPGFTGPDFTGPSTPGSPSRD